MLTVGAFVAAFFPPRLWRSLPRVLQQSSRRVLLLLGWSRTGRQGGGVWVGWGSLQAPGGGILFYFAYSLI